MHWKNLSQEDRQHIAPVTTLRAFVQMRESQRNMYGKGEACKECLTIGYKLGIEPAALAEDAQARHDAAADAEGIARCPFECSICDIADHDQRNDEAAAKWQAELEASR